MDLLGKHFVVTGAAQGIGRAIANALATHGTELSLIDIDADGLAATSAQCREHGVNVHVHTANVADENAVELAFQRIADEAGRLDGLINNAGIVRDALLIKHRDGQLQGRMSLAQWQTVIDVNLTGVFLCGRAAATHIVRFGNGGLIVNLSSSARHGNIGQSNYAAAKAGVVALTATWAKELAPHGIRVGAVAPGFTRTDILANIKPELLDKILSPVPLHRLGEPHEIADAVLFIAHNDFYTGTCLDLDGGMRL